MVPECAFAIPGRGERGRRADVRCSLHEYLAVVPGGEVGIVGRRTQKIAGCPGGGGVPVDERDPQLGARAKLWELCHFVGRADRGRLAGVPDRPGQAVRITVADLAG